MKYRQLGSSNILVSEVSLGCWTLGGLNWVNGVPNGWANVDETEIEHAIDFAIDSGVNHFDNADVYGNGRAERMLGKILKKHNKKIILASKIGWFPGTAAHAYEAIHIRHQCEQSLQNLKRDTIDVYYFHHGDFGENDQYLDEAIDMMNRLRLEGKIRLIGLSAYSAEDFIRLVPRIKPNVLQSWAHIMDDQFIKENSPIRNLMHNYKISFVAFSPLNQGILLGKFNPQNIPSFEAGDHRKNDIRFSPEYLLKIQPQIEDLKKKFGFQIQNLVRAALQFDLYHECVSCVIPGFRTLDQVKLNLQLSDSPLTEDEFQYIKRIFKN
jgi:aryl-alcohol dehydrogenase-like predicted oxidoreductase